LTAFCAPLLREPWPNWMLDAPPFVPAAPTLPPPVAPEPEVPEPEPEFVEADPVEPEVPELEPDEPEPEPEPEPEVVAWPVLELAPEEPACSIGFRLGSTGLGSAVRELGGA